MKHVLFFSLFINLFPSIAFSQKAKRKKVNKSFARKVWVQKNYVLKKEIAPSVKNIAKELDGILQKTINQNLENIVSLKKQIAVNGKNIAGNKELMAKNKYNLEIHKSVINKNIEGLNQVRENIGGLKNHIMSIFESVSKRLNGLESNSGKPNNGTQKKVIYNISSSMDFKEPTSLDMENCEYTAIIKLLKITSFINEDGEKDGYEKIIETSRENLNKIQITTRKGDAYSLLFDDIIFQGNYIEDDNDPNSLSIPYGFLNLELISRAFDIEFSEYTIHLLKFRMEEMESENLGTKSSRKFNPVLVLATNIVEDGIKKPIEIKINSKFLNSTSELLLKEKCEAKVTKL